MMTMTALIITIISGSAKTQKPIMTSQSLSVFCQHLKTSGFISQTS